MMEKTEGTALTYENMMKAISAFPTGGEPVTVDAMGPFCSLKIDPKQRQGKYSITKGLVNHLQIICHPADAARVQAQLAGALFQVHRERYGSYGEG